MNDDTENNHAHGAELVSFFGAGEDGKINLVGIGLTDTMIEHIKQNGGILEKEERTGTGVTIAIVYAPTLNELVKDLKKISPGNVNVKLV